LRPQRTPGRTSASACCRIGVRSVGAEPTRSRGSCPQGPRVSAVYRFSRWLATAWRFAACGASASASPPSGAARYARNDRISECSASVSRTRLPVSGASTAAPIVGHVRTRQSWSIARPQDSPQMLAKPALRRRGTASSPGPGHPLAAGDLPRGAGPIQPAALGPVAECLPSPPDVGGVPLIDDHLDRHLAAPHAVGALAPEGRGVQTPVAPVPVNGQRRGSGEPGWWCRGLSSGDHAGPSNAFCRAACPCRSRCLQRRPNVSRWNNGTGTESGELRCRYEGEDERLLQRVGQSSVDAEHATRSAWLTSDLPAR
jgi:hypothetical protein